VSEPTTGAIAGPRAELLRRSDGALELRCTRRPTEPPPSTAHWLALWAESDPEAIVLTEEFDGGRRGYDYAATWSRVMREADALRGLGVNRGDRVVVIAPNGFTHLVIAHAAMLIGAIYAPIATQYLAPDADPDRLCGVMDLLEPKLIVTRRGIRSARLPEGVPAIDRLLSDSRGPATPSASRALLAAVDADAPTKLLLTSGSTGTPKAVIYSSRMLTANVLATIDVWPFVFDHRPILVDWLPWNHAFGGNANLNMVLAGGGTLHIDGGAGRPERLGRSVELIKRHRPTFYAGVPAGFQALLPVLEQDVIFRRALFGRADALFSAGAAMPESTFRRLRELSLTVRERAVPILSGWGSTEVGPGATIVPQGESEPGWIGPPLPGVTVKLVPTGDKHELRVKGPSVMPGYWRQPELTRAVFDEEGYFCSGDAGRLVDELAPHLGLLFDGRLANDFKLANGSWVNVDRLRDRMLALGGGRIRDVVIAGPDRPYLVAIFWVGGGVELDVDDLLARHNASRRGQTNLILAGEVVRGELAPDLLSSKGTIKPNEYRQATALRIDAIYRSSSVSAP
jgi:feruloyl-CoA synthase